jgi:hypothetical protein
VDAGELLSPLATILYKKGKWGQARWNAITFDLSLYRRESAHSCGDMSQELSQHLTCPHGEGLSPWRRSVAMAESLAWRHVAGKLSQHLTCPHGGGLRKVESTFDPVPMAEVCPHGGGLPKKTRKKGTGRMWRHISGERSNEMWKQNNAAGFPVLIRKRAPSLDISAT